MTNRMKTTVLVLGAVIIADIGSANAQVAGRAPEPEVVGTVVMLEKSDEAAGIRVRVLANLYRNRVGDEERPRTGPPEKIEVRYADGSIVTLGSRSLRRHGYQLDLNPDGFGLARVAGDAIEIVTPGETAIGVASIALESKVSDDAGRQAEAAGRAAGSLRNQ